MNAILCAMLMLSCLTAAPGFDSQSQVKPAANRKIDTDLLEACSQGDLARVTELIRRGANVNARGETGETPLHAAQNRKVAELLIAKGAEIDAKDTDFEMTPLFNAPLDVAELLLSKGADINARAKERLTPAAWCVYWDAMDKLKLLISRGADINAGAGSAKTPLHIAANWGKVQMAEFLVSKGANVNARDDSGWTPLHWAAFEGGPEVADFLIAKGADKNAKTGKAWAIFPASSTPLDIAEKAKAGDTVLFLKSRGCKNGRDIK